MKEPPVAALILAAGGSSRMGRPKALLQIGSETFIRRVLGAARQQGLSPLVVVTAPQDDRLAAELEGEESIVVTNPAWREGLASSIAAGIASIGEGAAGVMILLADQPGVRAEHLEALLRAFHAGADPVATAYGATPGVPAIFGPSWFERLSRLEGDRGAKALLIETGAERITPLSQIRDIDTPDDYNALLDEWARS